MRWHPEIMLIIGLTGGIASGKTAVSNMFVELGVPVVDTDVIARKLVQPNQPALQAITEQFGTACLNPDGSLNRAHLRQLIFADPEAKKKLEAILHPRIRTTAQQQLSTLTAPYCLLVVPLLIETGRSYPVDRILVVDVPEETQIERLMARDGSNREQAKRILKAQTSRADRLRYADDIIENSGSLENTRQIVERLHQHYLTMANENE